MWSPPPHEVHPQQCKLLPRKCLDLLYSSSMHSSCWYWNLTGPVRRHPKRFEGLRRLDHVNCIASLLHSVRVQPFNWQARVVSLRNYASGLNRMRFTCPQFDRGQTEAVKHKKHPGLQRRSSRYDLNGTVHVSMYQVVRAQTDKELTPRRRHEDVGMHRYYMGEEGTPEMFETQTCMPKIITWITWKLCPRPTWPLQLATMPTIESSHFRLIGDSRRSHQLQQAPTVSAAPKNWFAFGTQRAVSLPDREGVW